MQNAECRVENVEKTATGSIQERSFQFACRIVRLHQYLNRSQGTARTLAGQILRSGTSVGANLQEATAGQSKADFISKCRIALKEARETHYWLRLLVETGLTDHGKSIDLVIEADEIVAILTTIVKRASASQSRSSST